MKPRYSSRTRPWPGKAGHDAARMGTCTSGTCPRSRGSASMTVVLLMVVFTGLGLAMLQASAVHLKINGVRKFSTLLDCASENGLKRGLHDLATWLEAE